MDNIAIMRMSLVIYHILCIYLFVIVYLFIHLYICSFIYLGKRINIQGKINGEIKIKTGSEFYQIWNIQIPESQFKHTPNLCEAKADLH
jgi:hypothetical protein